MRRTKSTTRGFALAAALVLLVPLLLLGYYEEVHRLVAKIALQLLEKNDPGRLYAEIYAKANKDKIVAGAWMEDFGAVDGNERSLRHYYDPKTGGGPAYQPYFHLWAVKDGAIVSMRPRYPGALSWARDGAGTKDMRNWKGAIEAYDYSPASRAEAYFRLGHVVHLIADMAEPDHATNTIHAASGYAYPRDLNIILEYFKMGAGYIPGFEEQEKRLEALMASNARRGEERLGFEGFIEERAADLFPSLPGGRVNKRLTFESYFDTMGALSQDAIRNKFPLPIGLRVTPDTTEAEQSSLSVLLSNYSFIPAIDHKDPAEAERYMQLARQLLATAVRFNWGLVEFFHDIVNPPPYARSVTVSQGGRPVYSACWADVAEETVRGDHPNENKNEELLKKLADAGFHHKYRYERLLRRELDGSAAQKEEPSGPALLGAKPSEPHEKAAQALVAGVEAEVRIEFGPDPRGFSAPPEKMSWVAVSVGGESVGGKIVDDGTAWVGRFTPELEEGREELELPIEINGRDAHAHAPLPGRLAFPRQESLEDGRNFLLDSEPDFPAKASYTPPFYHVRNYEPGPDRNHKVLVRRAGEPPAADETFEPSSGLTFRIEGDVYGPEAGGQGGWGFSLMLDTTTDIQPGIMEKEEWRIYPKGQLLNLYQRIQGSNGSFEQFSSSEVTGLSRPPDNRLMKQTLDPGYARKVELGLFEVREDGRFLDPDTGRDGDRLYNRIIVSGRVDPYVYKLRYKGKGRDGRLYQAEFVFDSREWGPAGKNSAGQTVYKRTGSVGKSVGSGTAAAVPAPAKKEPGSVISAKAAGQKTAVVPGAQVGAQTAKPPAKPEADAPKTAGRSDAAGSPGTTGTPGVGGSSPAALFARGEELLKNKDYWGAAEYFRRTLEAYPAESNRALGMCYYFGGLLDAALKHLSEAYRRDPKSLTTVLYLATCNDKLGRRDEALRRYEEYLGLNPDDPAVIDFVRKRIASLK
jgi:TolA-binding protein